ncbi:hypothetical protein MKW94_020956, partial [Papaver nudicaule]|nr:hypothetical protein [Papaver nudicaule]
MALSFPRLSRWLWRGKDKETTAASNDASPSLDLNSGVREPSSAKTPLRRTKKRRSRDERRIDKEYDMVIVPADGGCLSGSESEDSDWSIGWMEPHGLDFTSDDEIESFAVLVPCYGRGDGAGTSTRAEDVSVDDLGNLRNQLLGC